ncbi:hypothetical protein FMJ29_08380 [Klebsiella michiganensis]|uniref:Rap1a/Tai family immunity protein n=1 Tax=Klebsiella michiganensis TaxID=1134687 RepID=UPI001CCEF859|nr:hypothetical protein [Klebsiella michiganensis]
MVNGHNILKTMVLTSLLMAFCSGAMAMDGNELYKLGQSYKDKDASAFEAGRYIGYIHGIADVFSNDVFCVPENTRNGQIYDIVYLYLQNNPKDRTKGAAVLTLDSLTEAYPCKRKGN